VWWCGIDQLMLVGCGGGGGGGGKIFAFTVEGQARSSVSREVVGWWMLDLARATAACFGSL